MATTSPRDDNRIATLRAALDTDGVSVINVCGNPISHALCVSDGSTGSDHGVPTAQRDYDRVPVLLGVSSADGETPVEIYADSSGNLLVMSN